MATWKGKTYKFNLETYPPGNHGYSEWAELDFYWDYSTASDILAVYEKAPNEEATITLFSEERAVANLVTMMDWYAVYNGQEALDKLVADLKKEYSDV